MTTEQYESELLLIDLSSIAHAIWHVSGNQPDPDWTATTIVDRVRALSVAHPHAAICCDSGKSFRADVDPEYKANRPEHDAVLAHQIAMARERLEGDGFPVWAVKGFEADDLVASSVYRALEIPDTTVLIVSADKDLLALVNGRVRAKSIRDGSVLDEAAVEAKMGVRPQQVADYLALVGDKSDNIIGAKGIGPVKAANLLGTFGSLDELYAAIDKGEAKVQEAILTSLLEFRRRMPIVRELIKLRTDVPLPFEQIAVDRTPKEAEPMTEMFTPDPAVEADLKQAEERDQERLDFERHEAANRLAFVEHGVRRPPGWPGKNIMEAKPDMTSTATLAATLPEGSPALQGIRDMAKQAPNVDYNHPERQIHPRTATEVLPPEPDFERQLEPRNLEQAKELASIMYQARLFSGYGSPQAVLSTILAGRELGLQAIASLRSMHIVEGKHCPSADLLRALVLRSGKAKYFRCTERTAEAATFETQRGDEPPMTLRYTLAEATEAGLVKPSSGWKKNPADMLVARASSKLARLVFPDVVAGLYSPDEF